MEYVALASLIALAIAVLLIVVSAAAGREARSAEAEDMSPAITTAVRFLRLRLSNRSNAGAFAATVLRGLFIFIAGLAGFAMMLAGAAILALQCYSWLQFGTWTQFSVADLLFMIYPSTWLETPDQWVGAHKILRSTPGFLLPIVLGYTILFFVFDLD